MFCADSAGLLEAFLQLLAPSVQTNPQIVYTQLQVRCDAFHRFPLQLHALDYFGVLGFESGDKKSKTATERPFVFGADRLVQFGFKCVQGPATCVPPTVSIDDGVPQDSIEPRCGRFFGIGLAVGGQRFEETVLHNVLGEFGVAETVAREGSEDLKVLQQSIFQRSHVSRLTPSEYRGNFTKEERCVMS